MFGKETNVITQKFFRIIMQSMAHPGKVYSIPEINITKGEIKYNSFSVVCFTLLDHEVKFSVIGAESHDSLIEHIFQLTKSRYVQSEKANYVIISGGSSNNSLIHLNCGELEFPDKSATVFYLAKRINNDDGLKIKLQGPGIKNEISFKISGVDKEDIKTLKNMNSEFPLGIDTIFFDENNQIVSLPRSSQIFLED
jgi:alpha-D-ribose 1-methylphosphonate 5-triphosphate synthase subunit PhnH